jgi:hypothetical protein
MNPIVNAITALKHRIPMPILQRAFFPPQQQWGGYQHNTLDGLDYRIRISVIEPRVMVDCNLVGGLECAVPLRTVRPQYYHPNQTLWEIPLDLTQNRLITRVYSIVQDHRGMAHNTFYRGQQLSAYHEAAYGMLYANTSIPRVSDSNIQLIGENTVLAHTHYHTTDLLVLRCVIENDEEFNNLPPASHHAFYTLVEYAVKSYIYNTLIIELDQGELAGGRTLGRFSQIIESYAEAEELYQRFLQDHWRKISLLSDKLFLERHVKRVAGGLH